jgi:hypothetical protein
LEDPKNHQDHNHRSNTTTTTTITTTTTTTTTLWNETIFLQTLKKLVQDGDVEKCTSLTCGLTPQFKRKVTNKAHQLSLTGMSYPIFHHHEQEEKTLPVKKPEHYKLKICNKKLYDLQQ